MKRMLLWSAGITVVIGLILAALLLFYNVRNPVAQPTAGAIAALGSDDVVHVTDEGWLLFTPVGVTPSAGFILYPGGSVDPRAYASVARQIAEAGYLVAIPSMPLNLAVFGANKAADVIEAYPHIKQWAIGGHSLGGVIAARYAAKNPGAIDGLALMASYPTASTDLSGSKLVVVSIYATRDGLVTADEIDDSRNRLPPSTVYISIEGGNHAQFGSYGPQKGDLAPAISAQEQQTQVAEAIISMLSGLN